MATSIRILTCLVALALCASASSDVARAATQEPEATITPETPESGEAVNPALDGGGVISSSNGTHTCGLRPDRTITCWGANDLGEADPPEGRFAMVSAGDLHTCGLRVDGTLECWGGNFDGRSDAPGGTFIAVSAGSDHTCGLRTDGTIECWGLNYHGPAPPTATIF